MPAAEIIASAAPVAFIVLKNLRGIVDLIASLCASSPTPEQFAEELRREAERLHVLADGLAAKQAEDRKILDARVPK
jgi:hypothetical protein